MATASGRLTGPVVMAWLSMSDMAGASTWVVRAAKLVRSTSVSPGLAGLGLERSLILKPRAPMELMAWRASGAAVLDGAEGGEAFDALGAAVLDAFDFVDLVADEFEEAGHDLA